MQLEGDHVIMMQKEKQVGEVGLMPGRSAAQKHLSLAIQLHVIQAVRESPSPAAESAGACFQASKYFEHLFEIFKYCYSIRSEPNIALFTSTFESSKYSHTPTGLNS